MEMMAPHQSGSKRMTRDCMKHLYKGNIFKDACMHVYLETCTQDWRNIRKEIYHLEIVS